MIFIKNLFHIFSQYNFINKFTEKSSLQFYLVCFLNALLIIIGLFTLIPIISIIFNNGALNNFYLSFILTKISKNSFLIILTILFLISNFANVLLTLYTNFILKSYYNKINNNFSKIFLEKSLNIEDFYSKFSSFIENDSQKIIYLFLRFFINFVAYFIQFFVLIIFFFIYLKIETKIFLSLIFLSILFIIYVKYVQKITSLYGKLNTKKTTERIELTREIFDNASLIKTESLEQLFISKINKLNNLISKNNFFSTVFANIIKPIIETLLIFSIFFFFFFQLNDENLSHQVQESIIILFAIFKFLPSIYSCYQSYIYLISNDNAIETLKKNLESINRYSVFKDNKIIIDKIEKVHLKDIFLKKNNFSLELNKNFKLGNKYLILGKNGSGKSTLLKSLILFTRINKGKILINNIDIKEINYKAYFNRIFFLNQNTQYIKGNIEQNIFFNNNNNKIPKIYKEFLGKTLINRMKNINTKYSLSGGQLQKIRLVSCFLGDYDLIVLDEPTNHLDYKSIKLLIKFIKKIQNKIVIISSNDNRIISLKFKKIYI